MISVIIPTLNEEQVLERTLQSLKADPFVDEIIVSDGGSSDQTCQIARLYDAKVVSSERGRPQQMNAGAQEARSRILFFLHADTLPPEDFGIEVYKAFLNGAPAGSFRLNFDSPHPLLQFASYLTKFSLTCFRFGDQSLYIERKLFLELGGFDKERQILEDQDFIKRIKKRNSFSLLPASVLTSSRRYLEHGVWLTKLKYIFLYLHYVLGGKAKTSFQIYRFFFKDSVHQDQPKDPEAQKSEWEYLPPEESSTIYRSGYNQESPGDGASSY